jgi:hypothetical protein
MIRARTSLVEAIPAWKRPFGQAILLSAKLKLLPLRSKIPARMTGDTKPCL